MGLVCEGGALAVVLADVHHRDFLRLCTACAAVICCRVSPIQKAPLPPPPSIPQLPPPWDTTTPPQGQLQPMNSEVRMKGSSDTLSEVQRTTENDLHAVQAKVALMVKKAGHSVLCIGDGGGPLACPSCRASYASVALPLLLC